MNELVAELARKGIQVSLGMRDDQLSVSAPKGALSEELRQRITQHKRQLLQYLRTRTAAAPDHDDLPSLTPDLAHRHEPFPLTDIQQAYWLGRGGAAEMGDVSIHVYWEHEFPSLDVPRMEHAWQKVILRHDMLRAVILPDGRQQILREVPPLRITVLDLSQASPDELEAGLCRVRDELSHQVFALDVWPQVEVRATLLPGGRARLHQSVDLVQIDGGSLALLARDVARAYAQPDADLPSLDVSFRDYVLAEATLRDTETARRSLAYWRQRVRDLPPPPELPLARAPSALAKSRFHRRVTRLDAARWEQLQARAKARGLTLSIVLISVYAEILARWSKSPRFTLNIPLFSRLPLHPQVSELLGDFTSMVLLGLDLSVPESFEVRAKRAQAQLWTDMEHSQHISGVHALRELARVNKSTNASLPIVFASLLSLRSEGFSDWASAWKQIAEPVFTLTQTPQIWMDNQVQQENGELAASWDVVEELFPEGMLDAMFDAYRSLLVRLADDETAWTELPRFQLPADTARLYEALNATEVPLPAETLPSLFWNQVKVRGDAPAVVTSGRTLGYGELFRRSNQLAHRLKKLGCARGSLVAVAMEKGWEQVVAVLGIHGVAAAYLPIDPELPPERLRYLLQQVRLVVTQGHVATKVAWPEGVELVLVVEEDEALGPEADAPPERPEPDDLAYVLYTSGSTGLPKGAMLSHRNAVNRMLDVNARFGIGPDDRCLALTALNHDLSVYDLFGVLGAGGGVVLPDAARLKDPLHWLDRMNGERVSVWNSVPAFMEMLVETLKREPAQPRPSALRRVLLAGDWIPVGLPDRIRALAPEAQVIAAGGPTETAVWDICYPVAEVDPSWPSIPYGRPMANARYYVMDENLEPRPTWVPGQLHIAGAGVGLGYWGDAEKTRQKFIEHPRTGERLYRSGDLGRLLPDGNIEFLGREDLQVKIQGQRIELGEIESTLAQHPAVRAGVATVVAAEGGRKRLVAFAVLEHDRAAADENLEVSILDFLRARLPSHMIPTLVLTEALPLSANGKVDRKALAAVALQRAQPKAVFVPPASELERTIGRVVQEALALPEISADGQFFELGADSNAIVRITAALRAALNIDVRATDPFRFPTVRALAAFLSEKGSAANAAAQAGTDRGAARREMRGRRRGTAA
ncbi:amino acid adenylation domain-containing protein [Pendulispora rubella]|uniref:Amino acid adenylation domain-containing protein n=1 Tax=Pendulispora rubella TaxID=2741070 RepID=A0ABZ2L2V7_9BACT